MLRVGFLGAGKMAQALAQGFLKSGFLKSDQLIASCAPFDKSSAEAFKALDCKVTSINAEVIYNSDVVILAVKPDVVPTVLTDINQCITDKNLLLSIAMGVTIQALENMLPKNTKIIRLMPNIPVSVQRGVSVFVPNKLVTGQDIDLINKLLRSVGTCDLVSEYLLDVVTALSGSGPAYIYVIMEAMADGAVRMGMPRDLAYKLVSQTILGAAEILLKTKEHPGKLKDDVTSPAGSTAEGLYTMEVSGIRAAMIKTLEMATKKCRETSNLINKETSIKK